MGFDLCLQGTCLDSPALVGFDLCLQGTCLFIWAFLGTLTLGSVLRRLSTIALAWLQFVKSYCDKVVI